MTITVNLSQRIERAIKRESKKVLISLDSRYRVLTSSMRLMPSFIIIGAMKSGTTSLYKYLTEHPRIGHNFTKEVHFFDYGFHNGVDWYKTFFPLCQPDLIAGEASPDYFYYPHAPRRVFELIPSVKLIVVLRNPVDRALSHYNHILQRREVPEPLSFEDAINIEGERLNGEMKKMLENESYYSHNYLYYSYLTRGIYIDQLKNWLRFFPREQILVLKSEDLFTNPQAFYDLVLEFLGLPGWQLKEYKNANKRIYSKMNSATRSDLINYFKPHNQRLYRCLDINFDWDK
jgi:hypothetical protein